MSKLIHTTNARFENEPLTIDPEGISYVENHKAGCRVALKNGDQLIVGETRESFEAKWMNALGGE